ncbi:hypothetical protein QOM21_36385 [Streptomyces sp. Pv4-95]|uniref:hypothetical protein n=1 Tax=Streptomyces sp. Pv4-95 TaxID=3049543 RepID=UPI0038923D6B
MTGDPLDGGYLTWHTAQHHGPHPPPSALKDKGTPVPEIAKKLVIKTGKNVGEHPLVASVYLALTDAEEAALAAVDGDLPLQPKPVRIRRPGDPLTTEEIGLRERPRSQPHPNAESAADHDDQALSANGCTAGPHGRRRRRGMPGRPRARRSFRVWVHGVTMAWCGGRRPGP